MARENMQYKQQMLQQQHELDMKRDEHQKELWKDKMQQEAQQKVRYTTHNCKFLQLTRTNLGSIGETDDGTKEESTRRMAAASKTTE